jgi:hypothetical protein
MIRVQKRYLYASILSSLSFVVCYLIFDFNLILSLALCLGIYLAGVFIFKEKDVRIYEPETISRYYFLASKLLNYNQLIQSEEIKEQIISVCSITEKILQALEQKPKKVTQVYNFFDYYLNLTVRIVDQYVILKDRTDLTVTEETFLKQMSQYLSKISMSFQKQLDNMYLLRELDMNDEIKMFQEMLETDGFAEVSKEVNKNV